MCETCGCGDPHVVPVDVKHRILAENDHVAAHNRLHFEEAGVTAVNLMGSPGSGKTALLEATALALRDASGRPGDAGPRLGAVSGDLATDNDAARLRAAGIPSASITTGSACHLDARLVHESLHALAWKETDYFFIENVGNLVCPAIYDLGQAASVVCLSVTEGDDKPLKYPVMFRKAGLVVLTKVDLVPHLPGFSRGRLDDALARVMPEPRVIAVSATSGEGIDAWIAWLSAVAQASRQAADKPGDAGHHTHSHSSPHDHAADGDTAAPGRTP